MLCLSVWLAQLDGSVISNLTSFSAARLSSKRSLFSEQDIVLRKGLWINTELCFLSFHSTSQQAFLLHFKVTEIKIQ